MIDREKAKGAPQITPGSRLNRDRQAGLATVELALVASLMFLVIFAIVEFGRLLWTWGTLGEATRRGARIAAVCPPFGNGLSAVRNATTLRAPDGSGDGILPGFTQANVEIEYLDLAGNEISSVDCDNMVSIRFVKVEIEDSPPYQVALHIPGFNLSFDAPDFETIIPSENLGVFPADRLPSGMDPALLYCDFSIDGTQYFISASCP